MKIIFTLFFCFFSILHTNSLRPDIDSQIRDYKKTVSHYDTLISIINSYFSHNTEPFMNSLPDTVKNNILWYADHEENDLSDWEDKGTDNFYAGGGIFLTDRKNVSYGTTYDIVHSGKYASFAQIKNAIHPGKNKAVRFMRWTDKAWDEDGDFFPEACYYSVFIYFPEIYDPAKDPNNDPNGDGGWWNTFQFKSDNNAGSMPVVMLDLYNEDNKMFFALITKDFPDDNSDEHTQNYIEQNSPLNIPTNKWIHIEAYYKKSKQYNGEVVIWQDGIEILRKNGIRTVLPPGETATWGIGNYTDYVTGGKENGNAIIYFDDAIISETAIHPYVK